MKQIRHFLLAVLLMSGTGLWAQAIGDYGSAASGNWGTAGTWIVCVTTGTWDGATVATSLPSALTTVNFWIRNGHTVNVEASPKYANNITIDAGGKLSSDGTLPSTVRYLRISGTTLTVNGQFGTGSTDGLGLYAYGGANQSLTITGSGPVYVSRFQPQAAGQTLIIDANAQFDYAGSSGTGSTALYPNSFDNYTITVNAGKTLTMANNAYLAVHGSSGSSSGTTTMTINILGTLTASGTNSCINLNTATGKTVALNIGATGILNVNGPLRAHYLNLGTTSVNIVNGGQINCSTTGTISLPKSTISNNGSLNFLGINADSLGITTVSSTGSILVNKTSSNLAFAGTSTINGALTFTSGTASLGANNLTIGSTGSISGGSSTSYIITNGTGKLIQSAAAATTKLFPIGASSTSYDPVSLTPTDATDVAVNVGTTLPAAAPSNYTYNSKVWNITPTAPSSTVVTLTPSSAVTTANRDVVAQYVTDSYVNTVATKSGNAYTATFTSFSPFVTGTTDLGTALAQTTIAGVTFDGQTIHNALNVDLQVFDIAGRKVVSSNKDINMASNTKGIYLVKSNSGMLKIVLAK